MNKQLDQQLYKKIILISGKRTCGKDTSAKIISDYYSEKNYKVCTIGFAQITKMCYCKEYNVDH